MLYFWTPIRNKPNLDVQVFNEFYNKIYMNQFKNLNLVIRPHPSDKSKKYKIIKTKYKQLEISGNKDLLKDLEKSKVTFGYNSMATYLSDKLGINSYNIVLKNKKNIFLQNKFGIKNILLQFK